MGIDVGEMLKGIPFLRRKQETIAPPVANQSAESPFVNTTGPATRTGEINANDTATGMAAHANAFPGTKAPDVTPASNPTGATATSPQSSEQVS